MRDVLQKHWRAGHCLIPTHDMVRTEKYLNSDVAYRQIRKWSASSPVRQRLLNIPSPKLLEICFSVERNEDLQAKCFFLVFGI